MAMKVRYTVHRGQIVSENRGGVERDYVPDPLGSTVALLDSDQTKTDTFEYWPYGEERTRTGTTGTPFRYVGTAGYYRDSAGRIYVRARPLDPVRGRWLTKDPLPGSDGSYGYAAQNPTRYADPTGLFCRTVQEPCDEIIKGIVGIPKEILNELIECIRKACGDQKKTEECVRKVKTGIPDKIKGKIKEYAGCLYGAYCSGDLKLLELNPCKPPSDKYCLDCCGSVYVQDLFDCREKRDWQLCAGGKYLKFQRCQANCRVVGE